MVDAARAVVEPPARRDQQRQRDQRDRRQGGGEVDERHDREHDLEAAPDHLDESFAEELVERLDVGGQARHEHAGTLLLEEPER